LKTSHLYGFNIGAVYMYLGTKVIATNTVGGIGKHPVGIPMQQASFWTTYRSGGRIHDWRRHALCGGSGGRCLNTLAVPSFSLYDVMVRYRLGQEPAEYALSRLMARRGITGTRHARW
jgi:iron complex outermembrane recepter protein